LAEGVAAANRWAQGVEQEIDHILQGEPSLLAGAAER
jgi:hypothetical protein